MSTMRLIISGLFISFTFLMLAGCGSTNISVDEAYHELEPVKELELPEQSVENLEINITNVADEYNSYKNRVQVLINNKIINPNWNVSNIEKNYSYALKVKPGYYDIKAFYYAYVGWGEEKYEIKVHSPVRVSHDAKTIVEYELVKQENGEPVGNNMFFTTSSAPFEGTTNQQSVTVTDLPGINDNPSMVTLQINTIPENAKIILDDQVVGNAPMKIEVNPDTDYVLQLSANGYKTYTKLINKSTLQGRKKVLVIQELQEIENK